MVHTVVVKGDKHHLYISLQTAVCMYVCTYIFMYLCLAYDGGRVCWMDKLTTQTDRKAAGGFWKVY